MLAKRVIEAFSLMIEEGLTSCDDRIISALEEIENWRAVRYVRLHKTFQENRSSTVESYMITMRLYNVIERVA